MLSAGGLCPKTLEAARLAQELSLAALAERCGISAPTLSRIEAGTREASPFEIESLATALDVPASALTRQLASDRLGLSVFYHRKLSRAGKKSVRAVESKCLLGSAVLRDLLAAIDLPSEQRFLTIDLDEDARGNPERAADMVRMAWKLPRGPIHDLCSVVERAGCLIVHTDFGVNEMDALYQQTPGVPPVIWVNSRKPFDRIRFSIAHELGHLVLHEERPVDNAKAEQEADAFAAAFLMPRSDFRGECPARLGIPELVGMKRRWRCSMSAIARRARDTGKINDRQYQNLMILLSKEGWRKSEPYPILGENPQLLANTINRYLLEFDYSIDEMAARLMTTSRQLESWRQPFPGERSDPDSDQPRLRLAF